ncbi:MAG: type II toxin-antitoxin system VapC family toxin [Caldilineaceae bacterium]
MTKVVVDSGITLKLVLKEDDSHKATALWLQWAESGVTPIAPTIWRYETTSVMRNKTHRGIVSVNEEEQMLTTLLGLTIQVLLPSTSTQAGLGIERRYNRPAAYDAHYLALAEFERCQFWTADKRLFNAVRAELDWVRWLGEL